MTDDSLETDALEAVVQQACAAGPIVVQVRAKNAGGAALLAMVRRLAAITSASGSLLSVNDRIDVALASGADGVHLPATGMASERVRKLLGAHVMLGRSVHSIEEIERERATRVVDYLQFGPVFATPSKAAFGAPQGLPELARAVERARPLALMAVGGVDAMNAGEVIRTGAAGIVVIRAVMRAEDPVVATRRLLHAISAA